MATESFNATQPELGKHVFVHSQAFVNGSVNLGDDVSVWPMAVIRGDVNHILVGRNSNIQDGCIIHVTHDGPYSQGGFPTSIGDNVTLGHQAVVHGATIGDACLIGMQALILDGAILEKEVFVAAGSLVAPGKILKSGGLYRGRPAERVRDLTANEIESLYYSAEHYVRLKNQYLQG